MYLNDVSYVRTMNYNLTLRSHTVHTRVAHRGDSCYLLSFKISSISVATSRPFILALWNETFLYLNVEVWFLTMLYIKIFKDYLPNFSSISYIRLEGRTAATEMLLILKLNEIKTHIWHPVWWSLNLTFPSHWQHCNCICPSVRLQCSWWSWHHCWCKHCQLC